MSALHEVAHAAWLAEAASRFGPDPLRWRFVCPACAHVASIQDYKDAGAPLGAVGRSCVGRWLPNPVRTFASDEKRTGGPCDYTDGGLFKLNPQPVRFDDGTVEHAFALADAPAAPPPPQEAP